MVVPLVELALLLQVAERVGSLPTVALVVFTGALGAVLARRQGLRAWSEVQRELARGRSPGSALVDGLAILVGAAFLLTPGILTDAVGFGLLVPRARRWLAAGATRAMRQRTREGAIGFTVYGVGGEEPTRRAEVRVRDPQERRGAREASE